MELKAHLKLLLVVGMVSPWMRPLPQATCQVLIPMPKGWDVVKGKDVNLLAEVYPTVSPLIHEKEALI